MISWHVRRSFLVVALVAGAFGVGAPAVTAQEATTEARVAAKSPASLAPQGTLARKKACAGLSGTKLRRCKALARCKKLKGRKRKKCFTKARKIGVNRNQPPPKVQPPPSTQPPPTAPPPPANQAPTWPNPFQHQTTTSFQYDPVTGYLIGAATTINVSTPAVDPNGDPVTYAWSASNGSISGSGLSATWTRVISAGRPTAGTATVTASDGRGGSSPFSIRFL